MKKKLSIIGTLFLAFFSFSIINAQEIGQAAPEFSYKDLEGNTHSLSDYKGKVLFLNVFGHGCPYCLAIGNDTETRVNQVYGQNADFQAIGLDTWSNSTVATVGEFRMTTGITYPLLLQAGSFEQLYSTTYDRLIIVDREGIIRHKNKSLATEKDLDNAIAILEDLFLTMDVDPLADGLGSGLEAVYPNPSNDQVNIRFNIKENDRVSISVYNPLGQEVKRIVDNTLPAGEHKRIIRISDLSSGIYFIRMETAGKSWSRKFQISR